MKRCRGFADLLPADVYVEQAEEGSGVEVGDVWPVEIDAMPGALPGRRAEFLTTRACARRALVRMGLPAQAIPVGADRGPVWPPGVVGSLTHSAGLRAAAVAHETAWCGIGIDVEPNQALPAGVIGIAAAGSERAELQTLRLADAAVAWDRLLFSAKEAIFKAWFPVTGHWLGFDECTLSICASGTFVGHLSLRGVDEQGWVRSVSGRWGVSGLRLLTAVAIPAPANQ